MPEHHSTNVELNIEELVLHGFAPGDRHRIGEMVERELTRLLAEQGAPRTWQANADIAHLNGGSFTVHANATPESIGLQIAHAVYGGRSE